MLKLGIKDYYRRQRENNPTGRLAAGYVNMLDAILQLYSDRFDFFRHTDPEKNPIWRPGCTASSWRRWSSIRCM